MLPADVRAYLDAHREEHLQRLMDLLRFPSVANVVADPHPCDLCADWLAGYLADLGLDARILPTAGKPCVYAESPGPADSPTVLIYGHYDVQPAEPLDLWDSPAFEPVVRDGKLYARGANDDKGQLFTHLMAVDAWMHTSGLPVGVKILLEGEEEIGSPTIEPFLVEHRDLLAADACVVSDSEFFAEGIPSITYALRGLCTCELTVTGPQRDIHSGIHGGAVANPVNALARLVASLHDEAGRVTVPGFYDDVLDLSNAEHDSWSHLPFNADAYARELGVNTLAGGERDYSPLERRWARPTLDCNGIVGGYTGPGDKTIIPSVASTKISMRLVPDQDPKKIYRALESCIRENAPAGVEAKLEFHAGARAVRMPLDSPAMQAAMEACEEGFGRAPAMIRCGASVPITELIQRTLGLDPVMLGFGLPDDNIHSPNEKFDLEQLYRGSATSAAMLGATGRLA